MAAGERVGLIKFGSRADVLLGPEWEIVVRPGTRVAAGSSVIARRTEGGAPECGLENDSSIRGRRTGVRARAAYALPTLFTAGNIFLGYLAILRSFQGAMAAASGAAGAAAQFETAAIAIGAAVFLDGLDGRIARMTNTTSDFGREMDSLADVISFGIAPAVLAFAWGVQFVDGAAGPEWHERLTNAGYFIAFLFLLCGAARLARFNIQKNPIPKNPGRPDRKYFVGLPIPAAAALVAALVYAGDGEPLQWWPLSVAWLALLLLLGFLMVSTWRYYSFKGINLTNPYTPLLIILLGGVDLRHLELLTGRAAGHGGILRGQRHRHSHRRHSQAPFAPRAPSRRTGASNWLNPALSPWWAATRCWDARCAISSPPPHPRSTCG